MSSLVHPWPTLPLGELVSEMCLGKMLDKQKNRGTLQPYLRNVNVRWFSFDLSDLKEMRFEEGERGRYELRPGDLVICEGGEPGRAAVWGGQAEDAKIQKALHRVRFRPDEYEPRFAMYYLYFGTVTNGFVPYYTGTTIKHLTGAALSQIPFPIPPLEEQRRIVAAIEANLTRLDAGVANLERVRAKLKRYRAAVLKAACEGRLVPTEAELARAEGRPYEPADRLLARILQARRERWEAEQFASFEALGKRPSGDKWKEKYREPVGPLSSSFEDLPEGWSWTTVDTLLVEPPCNGISVKGSDSPPGVPALRLNAMSDLGFDYTAIRFLPIGEDVARDLGIVEGDFFVSRGNGSLALVGRGTPAQEPPFQVVFPDTMIRLRFCPPVRSTKWVATIWSSALIRRQIEGMVKTTAGIWKIAQPQVASILIPFPPQAEQARIVAEVERRLSLIDELDAVASANLKRAERLRQSILKRAFEGKLVPQDPADEPAAVLLERIAGSERQAVLFDDAPEVTMKGRRPRGSRRG